MPMQDLKMDKTIIFEYRLGMLKVMVPGQNPNLVFLLILPDLPGQGRRPLITALSPTSAHVKWEPPERDYSDIVNYDIRYIPRSTKDKSDANWTIIYDAVKNKDANFMKKENI